MLLYFDRLYISLTGHACVLWQIAAQHMADIPVNSQLWAEFVYLIRVNGKHKGYLVNTDATLH